MDSVNWVNVVALTPDLTMVLVEQYRQGSDTVELEIPGGMMDAQDASPEADGDAGNCARKPATKAGSPRIIGKFFPTRPS